MTAGTFVVQPQQRRELAQGDKSIHLHCANANNLNVYLEISVPLT